MNRSAQLPRTTPVVGVYRSQFLPYSETFIRDHVANMPRYTPVPITNRVLPDSLSVPGREPVVAQPQDLLPRVAAGVLRRAGLARRARDVALADALRRSRSDLVHAHFGVDAAQIMTAARMRRLPLVATFHGYDVTMEPKVLGQSEEGAFLLDRWSRLAQQAAAIVTVSDFLRGILVARGFPEHKLHVIACGVRTGSFTAKPLPDEPSLLFVGRLVEKKGVGDALEALAGMTDPPPFEVIGSGPLLETLRTQAAGLRLDCRFRGAASSDEIREAMARASIVVMPSKRSENGDSEGLGVTALEAAASGRPLVGYAHGGLSEAVEDGVTGLLAPEGDVLGLRARMQRLVDDPALANSLGSRARERVAERFEADMLLNRMADVYDGVLARR